MTIQYFIEGQLLAQLGIIVTGSSGVIDAPKMKEPFTVNLPSANGEVVNLQEVFFEPKTIILDCVIEEASNVALALKIKTITDLLFQTKLLRLMIVIEATQSEYDHPLTYQVYAPEGIVVKKNWRGEGNVIATFQLKLVEPEPVKKVLRFTTQTDNEELTLNLTCPTPYNIYWGDGNSTLAPASGNVANAYATAGTYYIVITGDIDNLTVVSLGNSTVLWERLL